MLRLRFNYRLLVGRLPVLQAVVIVPPAEAAGSTSFVAFYHFYALV